VTDPAQTHPPARDGRTEDSGRKLEGWPPDERDEQIAAMRETLAWIRGIAKSCGWVRIQRRCEEFVLDENGKLIA
jgi:hypothetical protein